MDQTHHATQAASAETFFRGGSKPYVRWWWLSGPFVAADIRFQLDWVKASGFGGVELAWMWPHWDSAADPMSIPDWLSPEWAAIVAEAKHYADEIGLGCDFTFGSCWPFGGSSLAPEHIAHTFAGFSEERLLRSWEEPLRRTAYVLDHLSRDALRAYGAATLPAFAPALKGGQSGLFCDSLEINTERLWSPNLWNRFADEMGYRLEPYCHDLQQFPDVRYDYRKFIAATMLREFYEAFVELCREQGSFARVQCHGSPTDLLSSYAAVDVPESEALLFEPSFSRIAASAAALAGKRVTSAETFTCIYGYVTPNFVAPLLYWKREQSADLKLLADAMIACGVNQIVWHGMPYNPPGDDRQFYASVHVGPDSAFAAELPRFNRYLETVCGLMQQGHTDSQLALYLPNEDNWMLDRLPNHLLTPGAGYWWEMRYVVPPIEALPYQPLWISLPFLKRARFREGHLHAGEQSFAALYIDVQWLDAEALAEIYRLAADGLPVVLRRQPRQPGRKTSADYASQLQALNALPNVVDDLQKVPITPVVTGRDLPWYWVRRTGTDRLFFFAHPKARDVRYPLPYGFSKCVKTIRRQATIFTAAAPLDVELVFEPYQSLALRVSDAGKVEFVDVAFRPPEPAIE